MIASQGPQVDTVDNFWKMVFNHNVTKIVNLCRPRDQQTCEYVPNMFDSNTFQPISQDNELDFGDEDSQFTFGGIKVTNHKEKEIRSEQSIIRHLSVQDIKSKETKEVIHIHIMEWPDFGTPDENSLKYTDTLARQMAAFLKNSYQKKTNEKLLVHCYMGVGRTGTMCGLINCVISMNEQIEALGLKGADVATIKEKIQLSVFSIVRRMREQRTFMVITEDQYFFLYQYVTNYFFKFM